MFNVYIMYCRLSLVPKDCLPGIILYVGKVHYCVRAAQVHHRYYDMLHYYGSTLNLYKSAVVNTYPSTSIKPAHIT